MADANITGSPAIVSMVANGRIGLYIGNGRSAHYLTKDVQMNDNDKNKKSRAAEIIRMIRAKEENNQPPPSIRDYINLRKAEKEEEEMDKNFQEWIEEQENMKMNNPTFHNFEQINVAVNSMGLYRSIMEEIEHEKDPKVLKAFFSERLGQILEVIPDSIASAIDCNIKGL